MAQREQHERMKVRRPCVAHMRDQINYNQLKKYPFLYWSCPPDVGKQKPQTIAAMVLDGYEKGVFDMTIIAANETEIKAWLIEFKWGKNDYTDEQKIIAKKAANTKVIALKLYSLDEFKLFVANNLK